MPILKSFSLKNFRVFKEETRFELAPLTLLTGTNSSGKSSLIKALLLWQDSSQKGDGEKLDFSGADHRLGTFELSKTRDSESEDILFRFELGKVRRGDEYHLIEKPAIRFNYPGNYTFEVIYDGPYSEMGRIKAVSLRVGKKKVFEAARKSRTEDYKIFFDSVWFIGEYKKYASADKIREPDVAFFFFENKEDEERYEATRAPRDEKPEGFSKLLEIIEDGIFSKPFLTDIRGLLPKEKIKRLERKVLRRFLDHRKSLYSDGIDIVYISGVESLFTILFTPGYLKDDIKIEDLCELDQDVRAALPYLINHKVIVNDYFVYYLNSIQEDVLSVWKFLQKRRFVYIEAVRANSHRLYTNQSQGSPFNQFLLEVRNHPNKLDKKFVNKWLNEFGIGGEISIKGVEGVLTQVEIRQGEKWVNLADLGYGMTQLVPLILQVAYYSSSFGPRWQFHQDQDLVFLVEEPETNLHPAFQSKLADFFADAIQTLNSYFIIETHSEYLIRKLQYLTAKKEIKPEDTSIYYFYEPGKVPEGEPQVKKLDILEDGRLSGTFGPGFFDEADSLAIDLFTLQNLKSN